MRGEDNKMKQTEIGLIPDDWEVKKLGDICKITSGEAPSKFNFSSSGIPYFKVEQMNNCLKYQKETPYHIAENIKVEKGSIIFPKRGAAIETNKIRILFQDSFFDTNIMALTLEKSIDNVFFYYWLVRKELWKIADTTSIPQINNKHITPLQIPLPSTLAEQKKIAQVLSDVDSVIATLEKLIAKKKNIKQGTMQLLLTGKKRLPGFAKSDKLQQTEIGEIPADWEVKRLEEVFFFLPNNTLSRDCLNYEEGEYQYIHYGDVLIKFPSVLDCHKTEIPFINNGHKVNFDKYGIKEGDVIIADTAEDETCGKVTEVYNLGDKKLVAGLHTILCRPKTDDFAPKWLGYFMNYSMYHNQLIPLITGIKVSSVSKSNILSTKILIPPKSEQTAIANVLSDMDKEIEALEAKLGKYRDLKTGMMQQLLTGRIRLR